MPISSFLNEVTPIFPSQINFKVEGSKIFCSCALKNLTGCRTFLRNDTGFAHIRNRLTAVGEVNGTINFVFLFFKLLLSAQKKENSSKFLRFGTFLQCEKVEHGFRLICILT